ncbi:nitrogen regulation protein NR(II) [Burkholderia sp. S171]|uniref:two-component system sensor histidine kinase NtrB n=1 Tax=Burkholderia sp. S171 TaxID=1641860 RepID=UPI00131E85A3|nr:ATP-binding protein [Burkholderia sp. S171]
MTTFSAAVAVAVLIVLLIVLQLRRIHSLAPAVGSPVDADLSRQRYNNYAFAAADEAADREQPAKPGLDQTNIRRSAGLRPPRLSGRHIVHTHLALLSRGRFRRTSSANENELQPCHVKSRTEAAGGSRSAERQSRYDERFGATLDLLPLTILVVNPQGKTLFANAAAEKLFGYSREELIGVAVRELVPALQLNVSGADSVSVELAIGGREPDGHRDLVARRRDGTEFPAEVAINPVSWESETGTLTIVIDRTERYELLRNRQQLAHLTRVSTLGELAGSLAHELNQPLTAILSNAQAAQRFLATEPVNLGEVREILHDLVDDTHRASEVIRKIRALVKKGDLEAAPLSVASVIRDVALLVHSDAIVRGIRMRVAVTPELPPVDGDKVQLQQVVLNLLLNAFDALESRPALDREVAIAVTLEEGDTLRVAVRDSGTGLAGNTFDKLFLPFFTSKRDGLGLGLSISRSIVEMHGGRIWAQNNEDHGATFYFTLPTGARAGRSVPRRQP